MTRTRISAVLALVLFLTPFARAETPGSAEDELFTDLFGEAPPSESPDDILRIVKIEIEAPTSFAKGYVLSFVREINEGSTMKRSVLERDLAVISGRLLRSGMFYQASASYRVSAASLGEAADDAIDIRVIVNVSEGFWWGFNFSPWDLSLSYANLFHEGKKAQIVAGLNTQSLAYADPAIQGTRFFTAVGASHSIKKYGGGMDPSYIAQRLKGFGEIGFMASDDVAFKIDAAHETSRSLSAFILYPAIAAASDAELSALGLSAPFSSIASIRAAAAFGDGTYGESGGVKGRAHIGYTAYLSAPAPVFEFDFLGDARLSFRGGFALILHEELSYFPLSLAGKKIPEFLWATAKGYRGPYAIASGEFASLSRASLAFDSGARVKLGFTDLALVPELFYEIAIAKRASLSPDAALVQDFGVLLRSSFSPPVGRDFLVGVAFGLPFSAQASYKLIFEVE